MKHILKFNESSDSNIEILHDSFLGLEDDFNIKVKVQLITESMKDGGDRAYLNVMIYEIILKETDKTITPNFISSVVSNGDYHVQFRGSHNFDSDIDLVKKYMKYKFYRVLIDWPSLKNRFTLLEFSEELKKYSDISESYGFISLYNGVYGFGPATIVFAHE